MSINRIIAAAVVGTFLLATPALWLTAEATSYEMADHIVVRKAERKLYLMRGDEVLRSFRIALGLSPQGHKMREGDFRTPEGRYQLVERKANSDYFPGDTHLLPECHRRQSLAFPR